MLTNPLPPGGRPLGRYQLERELGRGGWGVVYLAHDTALNVKIALKVLAREVAAGEALERFKRELLLARSISHPGICRVFDLHEHDGEHFITMELIEGDSLEKLLEKQGMLRVDQSVRIVRAVARALGAAHAAGVSHRDLKPSNILIGPKGRPSLLDFGLATGRNLSALTMPGFTVGTLQYVAPELLSGAAPGPASDLYSLGVVLYRCLTGRLPFDANDATTLVRLMSSAQPVPPSRFNSEISEDLDRIVLGSIAFDPDKRYRSAAAFETALAAVPVQAQEDEKTDQTRAPWDGDIEEAVSGVIESRTYSQLLQQRVSHTTVVFTDIVGITPYFDKHGDSRGAERIEQHNKVLFPIVEKHRGVVIKTIGDAIMATFPRADGAVAAAIEMQRALEAFNRQAHGDDPIHIRVGIHSGQAIVEHADVLGNCVNVAARVSALASGDEILISSSTRDMLLTHVDRTSFHSTVELKGKQGVYSVFEVAWRAGVIDATLVTPPHGNKLHDDTQITALAAVPRQLPAAIAAPRRPWLVPASIGALLGVALIGGAVLLGHDDPPDATAMAAAPTPTPTAAERVEDRRSPEYASLSGAGGAPSVGLEAPGPQPEPQRAPEAPRPKASPPAPKRTPPPNNRAEIARLSAGVDSAMRNKGVIDGDVKALDDARRDLASASKAQDLGRARAAATKASQEVSGVVLDKRFVTTKLARLNARYDRLPKGSSQEKLDETLRLVARSIARGAYAEANQHLNQAFALLPGSR